MRKSITVAMGVAVFAGVAGWLGYGLLRGTSGADASDAELVDFGRGIYVAHCASCHGVELQGQPNWRERRLDSQLPAPPHNSDGHTWHHSDRQLFFITKNGTAAIVPGYQSDMPGFRDVLSDKEIWAALAYIKSRWPPPIRARQALRSEGDR